jgi:hypothetical protein
VQQRVRDLIAGTAIMFAVTLTWSLATPLMGVPDEPAHAVRAAAAAHGQLVGVDSQEHRGAVEFDVPPGIAESGALACMAFDPTVTADCQADVANEAAPLAVGSSTAELNLPTYYLLVGWPTLVLGGEAGMWAMRIVSALLCSLAVGVAVMELRTLTRSRWAITALAVSATPMVTWLAGSLNPNGLEWAAGLGLLATLLALGRTDGGRAVLLTRLATIVAMGVLLVSGRPVTLAWLLVAVVAGLVLADPSRLAALVRRPAVWVAVGIAGIYAAACALWAVRPPAYDPYVVPVPGMGESFGQGFRTIWADTGFYLRELVGIFGWKDTELPDVVAIGYAVVLGGIAIAAIALARGRMLAVLLALVAVLLLTPPIIQGVLVEDVGYMWQGRYMAAILGMLLLVAGVALDAAPPARELARIQVVVVLVTAAASAYTLLVVAQRFAAGTDRGWVAFLASPDWQPPLGTVGIAIAAAVVTGVAALAVLRAGDGPAVREVVRSQAAVR